MQLISFERLCLQRTSSTSINLKITLNKRNKLQTENSYEEKEKEKLNLYWIINLLLNHEVGTNAIDKVVVHFERRNMLKLFKGKFRQQEQETSEGRMN